MPLEVCVTLCDDCIESSKKIVNAFVQIELCHMKNAFMATMFFYNIINLALVTFLKQRSQ